MFGRRLFLVSPRLLALLALVFAFCAAGMEHSYAQDIFGTRRKLNATPTPATGPPLHVDRQPVDCRQTILVLDIPQTPRLAEFRDLCRRLWSYPKEVTNEKDRRGWWFGSKDVYTNSNAGLILADLITESLDKTCVFNVRSRSDLKLYYADKKDLIEKKLQLKGSELDKSVLKLDPVMIGREMGVDKVVIGCLSDSETVHSRTFGAFASVAALCITVIDVKTGQVDYTTDLVNHRTNSTMYGNLEQLADRFTEQVRYVYTGAAPTKRYETYLQGHVSR